MRKAKLNLLLSSKCNFNCKHCLSNTNKKTKDFLLTEQEINSLSDFVNYNEYFDIKLINFTGGEPTLFLDKIKLIKTKILKNITYHITTNGWFINNKNKLNEILSFNFDKIIISYDNFHKEFLSENDLVVLIKKLKEYNLDMRINFVYEKPEDLQLLNFLKKENVDIHISELIPIGNFDITSISNNKVFESTCHSFMDHEFEKITYIPQHGLTPCCGPLAFGSSKKNSKHFSLEHNNYQNNNLRKNLLQGNFICQINAQKEYFSDATIKGTCDLCSLIYKKDENNLSLYDLLRHDEITSVYDVRQRLSNRIENILNHSFYVRYLFQTKPNLIKSERLYKSLPYSIITNDSYSEHENIVNFVIENYYKKFPETYNEKDFENARKNYYQYQRLNPFIRVYLKNNSIVSTIFLNKYNKHPLLGIKSFHVGYWGYNKNCLSKDEAYAIKSDWLNLIKEKTPDDYLLDIVVINFNENAFKFVNKIGFNLIALKLDKK